MATNSDSSGASSKDLVVGIGVSIEGSIKAPGRVHLLGTIGGDLVAESVEIGESGIIEGSLKAKSADIYGTVSKDVEITETLMLRGTSRLTGDVRYRNVQIELGARLTCTMAMLSDESSRSSSATSSSRPSASTSSSASSGTGSSSGSSSSAASNSSGSQTSGSASSSGSSSSGGSSSSSSGSSDSGKDSSSGKADSSGSDSRSNDKS